ncbi:MAG: threonine synthase [Bacteroidia bacterium]|nr:threonine synthase [Bacteroidia bacterium]
MDLYSTQNPALRAHLQEAVMQGLAPDNGLYMPVRIPVLPETFWAQAREMAFPALAFEVTRTLLDGAIPDEDLEKIVYQAFSFDAPVVTLHKRHHILELFHGPTLAFKDFGARFMAGLMAWYNRGQDRELVILVATSGDTGGAVAAGFLHTPGIRVVILYPQGKVSGLQEKQLTALGGNITALEVAGTFDDCQALVKQAFLDQELQAALRLTSANSINIARLIPQAMYYFRAWQQVADNGYKLAYCVPSGNFGNLTAGILAWRMGLPVSHFVAATNANDVVPAYLASGIYTPRPSVQTLSNAMDVGNPSNFVRLLHLLGQDYSTVAGMISGYRFSDQQTLGAIRTVYDQTGYLLDPHGAVGYLAGETFLEKNTDYQIVTLETAHPSKFPDVITGQAGIVPEMPERLAALQDKPKVSIPMPASYPPFKSWLLSQR